MDESTDARDMEESAVFVRGTDSEFHVPDEVADLLAMKGTTTCEI